MVRATKSNMAHITLATEGGRYSIAIDTDGGKWRWQTGLSKPGDAASFRIIDRGSADTYRQAVHRSTGIVLNHVEA